MANGDAPATAPDVPHFDTRFLVQTPDGSTATQVLRTDRPLSTPELAAHIESQGNVFAGYPDAAPTSLGSGAVSPAASIIRGELEAAGAPSPAPADAAGGRTFTSQLPSVGLAAAGSSLGGAVGAMTGPAAPFMVPAGRIVGGGLGGAGGEALEIGGEKLFGWPAAEPGSAANRIVNAGIRSSAYETVAAPFQYFANVVRGAARPITEAATALEPVLTGEAATGAKVVQAADGSFRNINLALSSPANLTAHAWTPEAQQTLLGTWWQRQAGQAPEQIAQAWNALGDAGQTALAGDLRGNMQTVVDTIQSGLPIPDVKRLVLGSGGPSVGWLLGHPGTGAVAALPAAKQAVEETVPWVGGKLLMSPRGAGFLAGLPRAAETVAPRMTLPLVGEVPVPYLAAAGQSAATRVWPRAADINWTNSY
jgi:hypothetical protein